MATPRYFIGLCNSRYEVRVKDGRREILFNGKWVDASDFSELLWESGKRDEVMELEKYGHTIIRKAFGI